MCERRPGSTDHAVLQAENEGSEGQWRCVKLPTDPALPIPPHPRRTRGSRATVWFVLRGRRLHILAHIASHRTTTLLRTVHEQFIE